MKKTIGLCIVVALLVSPAIAGDKGKSKGKGSGSGMAGQVAPPAESSGKDVPPGLEKKGGLPPGIAKRFGAAPPAVAYIAIDPKRTDRAWFLIDGKWTLKTDFDAALKVEVKDALKLAAVPPPIPLPKLPDPLHVVSFK